MFLISTWDLLLYQHKEHHSRGSLSLPDNYHKQQIGFTNPDYATYTMVRIKIGLPTVFAVVALAHGALSDLIINNYCDKDVSIRTSKGSECERGKGGCLWQGHKPWKLKGGGKSVWRHSWTGEAVSVKISKQGKDGILQFEYTHEAEGLWWNISDLDGEGPGLIGTPFRHDRVGVTPSGAGSGVGTCVKIRCKRDEVCLDSYQHPDDPKTKWCPADTGDVTMDLCMPKKKFETNFP